MKESTPNIDNPEVVAPIQMVDEQIKDDLKEEAINLQEAVDHHIGIGKKLKDMNPEELSGLKRHLRRSVTIMLTIGNGALAAQSVMFLTELIDKFNSPSHFNLDVAILQGIFLYATKLLELLGEKDKNLAEAIPDSY